MQPGAKSFSLFHEWPNSVSENIHPLRGLRKAATKGRKKVLHAVVDHQQ